MEKNFALVKTDASHVALAIDEIIEHWVRKWKSCASSVSADSYNFAEALAADIDDLKEKLNCLLMQLQTNKKERSWTDLEPYIVKLTSFFDHYGPCRGGSSEENEILYSFDHSEVIPKSKGAEVINL